jgi:hypothetical protein
MNVKPTLNDTTAIVNVKQPGEAIGLAGHCPWLGYNERWTFVSVGRQRRITVAQLDRLAKQ